MRRLDLTPSSHWDYLAGTFAAISWGCLIVAGGAIAMEVLPPMASYLLAQLGGVMGCLAVTTGMRRAFRARSQISFLAVFFGGIPAMLFLFTLFGAFTSPLINDITTDLDNPPEFTHAKTLAVHRNSDLAYPSSFKPTVQRRYSDIGPLNQEGTMDDVFRRAIEAAQRMPDWEITWRDDDNHRFEAIATTRIFRFKDDIVVRLSPASEDTVRIDMRSRSRLGKGDLGANANRIRRYFDEIARATRS